MAGKLVLYVATLAWNVFPCWPIVLLAHALAGQKGRLRWERPPVGPGLWGLWTTLRPNSAVLRAFRRLAPLGKNKRWGAITLGHGGVYGPEVDDDPRTPEDDWTGTEAHENAHVEQFEVVALMLLVAALVAAFGTGSLFWPALLWWAAWPLYVGANTLVAVLRGEHGYRGCAHEEAARGHGH